MYVHVLRRSRVEVLSYLQLKLSKGSAEILERVQCVCVSMRAWESPYGKMLIGDGNSR